MSHGPESRGPLDELSFMKETNSFESGFVVAAAVVAAAGPPWVPCFRLLKLACLGFQKRQPKQRHTYSTFVLSVKFLSRGNTGIWGKSGGGPTSKTLPSTRAKKICARGQAVIKQGGWLNLATAPLREGLHLSSSPVTWFSSQTYTTLQVDIVAVQNSKTSCC